MGVRILLVNHTYISQESLDRIKLSQHFFFAISPAHDHLSFILFQVCKMGKHIRSIKHFPKVNFEWLRLCAHPPHVQLNEFIRIPILETFETALTL